MAVSCSLMAVWTCLSTAPLGGRWWGGQETSHFQDGPSDCDGVSNFIGNSRWGLQAGLGSPCRSCQPERTPAVILGAGQPLETGDAHTEVQARS